MPSPICMKLSMMIFGIVHNDNDATTASRTYVPQTFKKRMERHSVKPFLLSLKNQFSVPQTDSSKIAHALTSGMKMSVALCMTDGLMVLYAEALNALHGDIKL